MEKTGSAVQEGDIMMDAEVFNKKLKAMDMEGLVDQLWWCGCDPHYAPLWHAVMCELEERIEDGRL